MKRSLTLLTAVLAACLTARGDVELRLSIKVILGAGGTWPSNTATFGDGSTDLNLNSAAVIRENIKFTNRILANHGTCYRLVLRDDTIYTLTGLDNKWFTGDPHDAGFRNDLEDAATLDAASRTTWQWHDDAVNIYINNSSSGSCNFPVDRRAITLGAGAYNTILIHELGHFLGLSHTHPAADGNEPDTDTSVDDWGDGDASAETLEDDKDASAAEINARYDGVPAGTPFFSQNVRDDLIFNIMSYHLPQQDRFVWDQKELLIANLNITRWFAVNGRARFVMPGGASDADGLTVLNRMPTIGRAYDLSNNPADAVLIRSGTYNAVTHGLPATLAKPMTFGAWRGPVTITRPPPGE